jgi:hypothetical protein
MINDLPDFSMVAPCRVCGDSSLGFHVGAGWMGSKTLICQNCQTPMLGRSGGGIRRCSFCNCWYEMFQDQVWHDCPPRINPSIPRVEVDNSQKSDNPAYMPLSEFHERVDGLIKNFAGQCTYALWAGAMLATLAAVIVLAAERAAPAEGRSRFSLMEVD